MYKINFNGRYNDITGCHGKLVKRGDLQATLLSLLNAGMQVHHVSEIRNEDLLG